MQNIILYSIGCVKCKELERELEKYNIAYELCTDKEAIKANGFTFLPILSVDGENYTFDDAIDYIHERFER